MSDDYKAQLLDLQQQGLRQVSAVSSQAELKLLEVELLGRKSQLNTLARVLPTLSSEEKKEFGQALNQTKQRFTAVLQEKSEALQAGKAKQNIADPTLPGLKPLIGHLHPTTEVIRSINQFFHYLGYTVYEGPEIETDEYNFNKLNLPLDHPARELADTFYVREPEVLLRTHTSSVETRAMSNEQLPLRIVVPGKVYRNETSNVTNNAMFYQYEGLVVDKGLSMADLKGTLIRFAQFLYGEDVVTRFRCKYYPQVEPGAGFDIQCTFCQGKGCQVCKYRGWIEVLGSGMVHPNVLRNCGIDPEEWSGFAFGLGLDRLVMLKYGIADIRKLYNGELVVEDRS